ncbi:putative reverse transcriptase domain-containing protein [Tanacetum coccineum]
MYPEYMPLEDEILSAEEQPLPVAASPTADSPRYVPESDLEEEPEEDDEDPEEDPADYPADRDDDDDEEEEEPSGDDADDEDEDEDEEEEEEHPAPADSVPPVHQVERLLALTTPPPSPLTPLSSPLPQIPSPPLPASPPASVLPASPPASPIRPLGYRAAMIRLRAETPSTSHPLPLPTSSPPLQLLSSDRRADRPEITLPPRKRLGIDLGPRCEVGESSAAAAARPIRGRRADYGFVDPREAVEEVAPMTLEGVNTRVTELAAIQEQDKQDISAVIGDTQDRQTQIYQRVETLGDDSQYHYETARLLDQEALVCQEAWGLSIEVSYMARSEIMTLPSVVMGQQAVISQLQAADHRRAACADFDIDAVTTGTGDHFTGTGDNTAGTTGTLWRSSIASVTAALAARDATRNGDDSHTSGTGTKGVVELNQGFERMKTVFRISNYSVDNQIKFSTCTLLASALTWWNSHVRIVGQDVAYAMTWTDLRKKMTDKYCPRNDMKQLKVELWNLKVKELDKVERYVGGLPDMIQGSVVASKPKTMQEATEMASDSP